MLVHFNKILLDNIKDNIQSSSEDNFKIFINDQELFFNEIEEKLDDLENFKNNLMEDCSKEEACHEILSNNILSDKSFLAQKSDFCEIISNANNIRVEEIQSIIKEISIYLSSKSHGKGLEPNKFLITLNSEIGLKEVFIKKNNDGKIDISLLVDKNQHLDSKKGVSCLANNLKSVLATKIGNKFDISVKSSDSSVFFNHVDVNNHIDINNHINLENEKTLSKIENLNLEAQSDDYNLKDDGLDMNHKQKDDFEGDDLDE